MVGRACNRDTKSSSSYNQIQIPSYQSDVNDLFSTNQALVYGVNMSMVPKPDTFKLVSSKFPQTGDVVYDLERIYKTGNIKLMVVNETESDAILFIENNNVYQRYIRAKDSLLFTNMINQKLELYCYKGSNWNPEKCFLTIGNRSQVVCGKFETPSSSKSILSKTLSLEHIVEMQDGIDMERISIQDTLLENHLIFLPKKKVNKMKKSGKVIE
jgi:hypothetical protein